MMEYRDKPDIIKTKTPLLNLGNITNQNVLYDSLIPAKKLSNKMITCNGAWLNYENNFGYFKVPITNGSFLKELLGVKITKYFNLPTVEYKLATATWQENENSYYGYGLFSKYARNNNSKYTTLDRIYNLKYDYDDLSILDSIDDIYPNQPINKEFRYFIIRDFFTQEYDRVTSELLIENSNNRINLGPLMDYEMEWVEFPKKGYTLRGYLTFDLDNYETKYRVKKDDYFKDALDKLMDIDILKLLEEIKEEHQIRLIDYDKEYFMNQEKQIKEYVKSKNVL